ncbi:MAG: DNA polymerase beta superfamily protein [Xenococcaceae cyanobacterium]
MFEIDDRFLIFAVTGSQAYGLAIDGVSDIDLKGLFIAPKPYYLGLKQIEQIEGKGDLPQGVLRNRGVFTSEEGTKGLSKIDWMPEKFNWLQGNDFVLYELKKYLSLLRNANPNIQEMLWLDSYEYLHPLAQLLIENRQKFLTKKVKASYIGYANAQLKKVETHRKWLLNPPQKLPIPADFGFTELYKPLSLSELNAFFYFLWLVVRDCIEYLQPAEELRNLLLEKIDYKQVFLDHRFPEEAQRQIQEYTLASSDFMKLTFASRQYLAARKEWDSYQSWQKNRNSKRKEMEAKCGFDAKHASHALRLLYTGQEIIKTKTLIVDRRIAGDADYLLEVKKGNFPYEEVISECDRVYNEIKSIQEKDIDLPDRVDENLLNYLCIELVEKMGFSS